MTWRALAWRFWLLVRVTLRPVPSCPTCGDPMERQRTPGRIRRRWECSAPACTLARQERDAALVRAYGRWASAPRSAPPVGPGNRQIREGRQPSGPKPPRCQACGLAMRPQYPGCTTEWECDHQRRRLRRWLKRALTPAPQP